MSPLDNSNGGQEIFGIGKEYDNNVNMFTRINSVIFRRKKQISEMITVSIKLCKNELINQ